MLSAKSRNFSSLDRSASSARLRSVMSSPELSVAVILPDLSLSTELCQAMSLSSPVFFRIGFSTYSTRSICPFTSSAKARFSLSLSLVGRKLSAQRFPTTSSFL